MSDNTLQFKWIVTIKDGLDDQFADDPNVFVAGDLLWYPVERNNKIRIGPDVLIAFGRPKGYRGSYKQWEEGGIAPQVVFEILSPGNRSGELEHKLQFYQRYRVEEYYIYDPDSGSLEGWRRRGRELKKIRRMAGFVSPRLGIRFEPGPGPDNLTIIHPDGARFLTFHELRKQRDAEHQLTVEARRQLAAEAEQRSRRAAPRRGGRAAAQSPSGSAPRRPSGSASPSGSAPRRPNKVATTSGSALIAMPPGCANWASSPIEVTRVSSPEAAMRPKRIVYPDSDGEPMSEHTLQYEWIVTIKEGIDVLFCNDPHVFVAGTLLWYPVEGDPTIRTGPDVLVAFGRPKGDRGSYKQWEEGGIAPQVVFEIQPPTFRVNVLIQKFQFYERYGVEEFYIYNPDAGYLEGWCRVANHLEPIPRMAGFVSPRLGVRFKLGKPPNRLKIIGPDGEPFHPRQVLYQLTRIERLHAEAAQHRVEAARHRDDLERRRNEEFRHLADDFERLNDDYEHRDPGDSQRIEELRRRYGELYARLEELRGRTI